MSKICIDNNFNLITNYHNGVKLKKFGLSQLKMIWLCIEALNKSLLDYKFRKVKKNDKYYKVSDIDNDIDLDEYIEIDKEKFKKRCFGYRISDKNLKSLISKTNMSFENKFNNSFCNLFQGGDMDEEYIYFLPTIYMSKLLHCDNNHYSVDIEKILKFKSVNSIIFYQFYESNKFMIDKYKKDLIINIDELKLYFSSEMVINDFIRNLLKPSIEEYNKIVNEKIKIQPIKDGKTITSIKFYK